MHDDTTDAYTVFLDEHHALEVFLLGARLDKEVYLVLCTPCLGKSDCSSLRVCLELMFLNVICMDGKRDEGCPRSLGLNSSIYFYM